MPFYLLIYLFQQIQIRTRCRTSRISHCWALGIKALGGRVCTNANWFSYLETVKICNINQDKGAPLMLIQFPKLIQKGFAMNKPSYRSVNGTLNYVSSSRNCSKLLMVYYMMNNKLNSLYLNITTHLQLHTETLIESHCGN